MPVLIYLYSENKIMNKNNNSILIQKINHPLLSEKNINLFIKRIDLIHPEISGNKWYKLKYNIEQAKVKKFDTILTFGGAFSNHIAATAFAGKVNNIKTIGYIRGEETLPLNATLQLAKDNGMKLIYISREEYRLKDDYSFKQHLHEIHGAFYLIPEGGNNFYGTNGCMEILDKNDPDVDFITTACGTGSTLAGMILKLKPHQKAIGFPALKGGDFLYDDIKTNHQLFSFSEEELSELRSLYTLNTDFHFGGYAKVKPELINFVQIFKNQHNIELDLIYTGKMFYGIFELIKNNYFKPNTSIMAIHTGGIQGNKGMMKKYNFEL